MAFFGSDEPSAAKLRVLAETEVAPTEKGLHKRRRDIVLDYMKHFCGRERRMTFGQHIDGDAWSVRVPNFSGTNGYVSGMLRFDGPNSTLTVNGDDPGDACGVLREVRLKAQSPCGEVQVTKDANNPILAVTEVGYGTYYVGGMGTMGVDANWFDLSVQVYGGEIFVLASGSLSLAPESFWAMGRFSRHFCPSDAGLDSNGTARWYFVDTLHSRGMAPRVMFVGTVGEPTVIYRHSLTELRARSCVSCKETPWKFSNLFDFDADDRGVVVCADGQLIIWDVKGQRVLQVVKLDAIFPPDRRHSFGCDVRVNPSNGNILVFLSDGGAAYLDRSYALAGLFVANDERHAKTILAASFRAEHCRFRLGPRHRHALEQATVMGAGWVNLILGHYAVGKAILRGAIFTGVVNYDTAVVRLLLATANTKFNFPVRWNAEAMPAMLSVILPYANDSFKRFAIGSCLRTSVTVMDGDMAGVCSMVDMLLLHGCQPPKDIFSSLFEIVGKFSTIAERVVCTIIIKHGKTINLDATDHQGRVALQHLRSIGTDDGGEKLYRHLLRLLVEAGANVNPVVGTGVPPLLTAARRKDEVAARLLLEAGADAFQISANGKSTAVSTTLQRERRRVPPPYQQYDGLFVQMLAGVHCPVTTRGLVRLLQSAVRMKADVSAFRLILGARPGKRSFADDVVLHYLISYPSHEEQGVADITFFAFDSTHDKPDGTYFTDTLQQLIGQIVHFYVEDLDAAGVRKGWKRITHPRLDWPYVSHLGALLEKYGRHEKDAAAFQRLVEIAAFFDINVTMMDGDDGRLRARLDSNKLGWHEQVRNGAEVLVAWPPLTRKGFSTCELAVRRVVWSVLLCRQRLDSKWNLDVCLYMLFTFFSTDPRDFRPCWFALC